ETPRFPSASGPDCGRVQRHEGDPFEQRPTACSGRSGQAGGRQRHLPLDPPGPAAAPGRRQLRAGGARGAGPHVRLVHPQRRPAGGVLRGLRPGDRRLRRGRHRRTGGGEGGAQHLRGTRPLRGAPKVPDRRPLGLRQLL
ncbi:MAG: hypothetical protein AVDCRST_MAG10-2552, partial [uncultured Acidimicrobiales bacterium]